MARAKQKRWQQKTAAKIEWWMVVLAIVAISFLIAAALYANYDWLPEYWRGVATNTGGSFIDIVLIVVALGFYERWRQRHDAVARLRERIEEVKRFDDPRAHSILGAAIRGLANFGLTDIDLRGARLTNFLFPGNGIKSIAGGVISDGLYIGNEMRNFAQLRGVSFAQVNCNGACFGSGDLSFAAFDDCDFFAASLIGATFDGTTMRWSAGKVVACDFDWEEVVDTAEDGSPILARTYSPAFEGADLTDCSFKGVRFQNADFRGARNVGKADFDCATGLDTCFFDDGHRPATNEPT